MVSTVASSAASMASKASTARPALWVASRLHASTSSASREGAGVSPHNRWRSPGSYAVCLGSGAPLFTEAVRYGAAGRVQGSSAGAVDITLHARSTWVRRRRRERVWPNDDRMSPCTAALPYRFPAPLYGGVLPCYVPRLSSCILGHGLSSLSARIGTSHLYAVFRTATRPGGFHTDPTIARDVPERAAATPLCLVSMPTAISWPRMASSPGFPGLVSDSRSLS